MEESKKSKFSEVAIWLQKLGIWATVLGVIVSTYLSGLAVFLTYKYGENKDQIDTLSKIAAAQNLQLTKLQGILDKTTEQAKETKDLIGKTNISYKQLVTDTKLLSKQVSLLGTQQQETQLQKILSEKASYLELRSVAYSFFDLDDTVVQNAGSLNRKRGDYIAFVRRIKGLLENQLVNKYLLSHEALFRDWTNTYNEASDMLFSAYVDIKAPGDKVSDDSKFTPEEKRRQHKDFEALLQDLHKLQNETFAEERGEMVKNR